MDTVVISRLSAINAEPDSIFRRVVGHLHAGGALIVRLTEVEWANLVPDNDTAQLVRRFRDFDCHLLNIYLDALQSPRPRQAYTLCARKRARPLLDVVEEGLSTISVAYDEALDWVRNLEANQ